MRRASRQGMLTVSQLAQHLHLHPAWVYEHADELGAIRIGSGPKARIRFDLYTAKEALRQNQRAEHRRRRPQAAPDFETTMSQHSPTRELLPIHERRTLGAFARRRPPHGSGCLMARPATGQIAERKGKRGITFAARIRAYGERHYVALGYSWEGYTRREADTELQNILADVRRGMAAAGTQAGP